MRCNIVGSNACPMALWMPMRPLLLAVAVAAVPAPLLAQLDSSVDPAAASASLVGPGAPIDPQLGPYEALIPAPDQSEAALASALRSAMQSVIERQAGYGAAGTYEGEQLMSQARQYVLSYAFEVDATSTPPQTLLRARFDGNAVRSALARAGMITLSQTQPIEIEVSGIGDLADYQRVASHLRRLGSVKFAAPAAGNGDVVRFDLQVEGGQNALELALSTGGLLRQLRYGDANTPAQYVLAR